MISKLFGSSKLYNAKGVQSFQGFVPNSYSFASSKEEWHGTTILAVKKNNEIALIGDGQVTYGSMRLKNNGKKLRKLHGSAICGFAGSVADAFTLLDGLENVMAKYPGQTLKACLKYAKQWRTGKQLRHLEASILVCDKNLIVELDGSGNVVDIDSGVIGIGSGGAFAECAARALMDVDGYDAEKIAYKAMNIAAEKCIYTNNNFMFDKITWSEDEALNTHYSL